MPSEAGAGRIIRLMDNTYLAYALLALGIVLLLVELVLMTHGFSAVLGIGCLVAAVAMLFSASVTHGFLVSAILVVLLPAVAPAVFHFWKRSAIGRRMVLDSPDDPNATASGIPSVADLERYKGRYGKTASPLRPSGVVEFDGRRIDSISEGVMIDAGEWVRCIAVQGTRVIVRQTPRPPELGDLDTDALFGSKPGT